MTRVIAALAALVVLAACSGADEPGAHPSASPAPKITVSPRHWPPPPEVLKAQYFAALDERLSLRHSKADDMLLVAAARAVCGGWKAGMDYPRVVSTLPPWTGWRPWQEEWLVYAATVSYCPQFIDRLPQGTGT
jgi:hypothetical protein